MRILFICPDLNSPTGGIKQIYRQVDILNKNNIEAYVLHENKGFKCTWFTNDTKILYNRAVFTKISRLISLKKNKLFFFKKVIKKYIYLSKNIFNSREDTILPEDILVFPEVYGPRISRILPGVKKVIYNQGCYQTFFNYDLDLKNLETPYNSKDLLAVIVNSENAKKYINYAFLNVDLYRVHYGIDKLNFNYKKNKKQQITFMPRRLKVDLVQVINILKYRGILKNWSLLPLENMNEKQVSEAFKESAFFLSFSINEGFGMPPAEAMACGCVVVGYSGKGGEEFFKDEFSYPVEDRNVLEFAIILEKVLKEFEKDSSTFLAKGKAASDFILKEYAMEVEQNDIVTVWKTILEKNA